MSNFDFDPLTCDPTLFCAKNSKKGKKRAKGYKVILFFPKKGEEKSCGFDIFGEPDCFSFFR